MIRNLINDNGTPFESTELQSLSNKLDALCNCERAIYRDQNRLAIAKHDARRFLIVSGPGTGKSHLFLDRINYWFQKDFQVKILVTSFVRKLVADLQSDIDGENKLSKKQKNNITMATLHKFARSIVEKNHGTNDWNFKIHFRILDKFWQIIVWEDVLVFYSSLDRSKKYTWEKFAEQLNNDNFDQYNEWKNLKRKYYELCKFYNAAGFADLILRTKDVLEENPNLNDFNYFIIDEYQDFNSAEDKLIKQLVKGPKGLLIVGDDEQVLYDKLKSVKPNLIRDLYQNNNFTKGMLPFCVRSGFHITKLAEYFIQKHRETECIEKIYLPIKKKEDDDNPKVQIIACAKSSTAVDYIKKFVKDNKVAIDERKAKLDKGEEKDSFLLILTPAKKVNFYGKSKEEIVRIATEYQTETRYSEDYHKILSYYSLSNNPQNNFTFRKVLHYEKKIKKARIHELIESAMRNNQNFCDLVDKEIKNTLQKCSEIRKILEAKSTTIEEKIESISQYIFIIDPDRLKKDFEQKFINQEEVVKIELQEEEDAELEEIEAKKMGAIELITIVGSKGLTAEHVIIIGFDNVNFKRITKNSFYVAMTRARKSLHIITALKSGGAEQAHSFLDQLSNNHTEFYSYTKKDHAKPLKGKQEFKNYLNILKFHQNEKVAIQNKL